MPLELCSPTTIDLVVMLFINSMEIVGTIWGASLPLLKKIHYSRLLPPLISDSKSSNTRK